MQDKLEEMIALGASYAVNCHPCLEYHKKKALSVGVSEADMLLALTVGEQVRNGAHVETRIKAKELFGFVVDKAPQPAI